MENLREVPVDQIEQPTKLGSQCLFLNKIGRNADFHNKESIMHAFAEVPRAERLALYCEQYEERCAFFLDTLRQGAMPRPDDVISLNHHNGYYTVGEGKHRVCAAIQGGIKTITVPVDESPEPLEPYPEFGEPGVFTAEFIREPRTHTGHVLYVHANLARPYGGGIHGHI